jgi:ribosomal protein S18 acetylase RimI-like enzyme
MGPFRRDPLSITQATIEDAGAILALQKLAYRSEALLYEDWTLPPLTESVEELQAEFARQVILKALLDGRIIGSVRARMDDTTTCAIGRLMVHPEYQGQGIGTRLMQAVERHFNEAQRFELFTGEKSARNIRLYERLGYREFRRVPTSSGLTLVYMGKPRRNG